MFVPINGFMFLYCEVKQDEPSGFLDNTMAVAAVTVVAGTLALVAFLPTSLPIFPPQLLPPLTTGGASISRDGRSLPFMLIKVWYTILYFTHKIFN